MSNRSKRAKQFAVLGGSALVAAPMFGSGVADAATIEVTNLNDSGAGSLRDAIEQADGDAAADTITFAPGLTGTINVASVMRINSEMTITGPGAALLSLDGGDNNAVLYLYNSADTPVTISDLTVTNGAGVGYGAGIRFGGDIDLTLDGVAVTNNTANSYGGGIYMSGGSSLTVIDSEISGNSGTYGGGIYQAEETNEPIIIRGSTFENNTASTSGGALYVDGVESLLIEDSTFINNSAVSGGGAVVIGGYVPATIVDSTFSGNTAGFGGALYVEAIYDENLYGSFNLTITGSTFSANTASGGGGAIYLAGVYGDYLTIENSTFSANSALYGGAMTVNGFYSASTAFTISHSTFTQNSATNGNGGAIYLSNDGWDDAGVIDLEHTVISGNTATGDGDNIYFYAGGFDGQWSMIGNLDGATLGGANNLPEGDAKLGALADNGGPTLTHKPLAGSPLINAGDPAHVAPPEFDQRGLARVGAGRIDVGAVESDAGDPELPPTGSTSGLLVGLGAALLAVGGALHLTDRRRTRQI